MNYIMQIMDCIREVNSNIAAFHFVIYALDWQLNLKKFYWVKPEELPEKLEWLREMKVEFAKKYELRPHDLSVGLVNTVLVHTDREHHYERRFIPMIDFDSMVPADENVPERIFLALEMLGIGPGAIVRSSVMNFGFVGFHFIGFDLWDRAKWKKFVSDGLFSEYGLCELDAPKYPKMPYFSAGIIGESWCQLVTEQKGIAFLRVINRWSDSGPEILDTFSGGPALLEKPPGDALCMPPFREAESRWFDTVDETTRYEYLNNFQGGIWKSAPQISDFCVENCPINGCSTKCPATVSRFPKLLGGIDNS